MSDWYSVVAAEFKTVVLATLTEITAPNFWTVVEALKMNVVSETIKAEQGDTTRVSPPYFIMQLGQDKVPQDFGPDGRYYRLPVAFHYIIDTSPDSSLDDQAYCRSRLEVLRLALQVPGNLATCSWMGDDGEIDSSEDVAFANSKMTLFAASLSYDTGFLTLVNAA